MHQKKKAEAEAQRQLQAKADAAATAMRDAILAGEDPSQVLVLAPDVAPPAPSPSAPVVVESAYETLAATMQQKRPCPYASSKGSCNRMFVAGAHVTFCKMHTCTKVGCNAKKTSKDEFCPQHVDGGAGNGGGGGDEEGDEHDYDLTGDSIIDPAEMAAFAGNPLRVSKYVAPEISLGEPAIAAHGLAELMGISGKLKGKLMMMQEKAIIAEFERYGKAEDKDNLKHVLAGTYREDWGRSEAVSVTLEALLASKEAVTAHLELHHILALRLYTTSSFRCINEPLRRDPRPKQHPFAATTLFIQEGIKQLRAVNGSSAVGTNTFWRGMKDLSLPKSFSTKGGAEFACMSTSADFQIAVKFAEVATSASPLIFKYVTSSFMERGADISFLSVYPEEKEVLYPPLTYLEPVSVKKQRIKGKWFIVAEVKPHMS